MKRIYLWIRWRLSIIWYHFRKWVHWEFGLHRWQVMAASLKESNYIFCKFCGQSWLWHNHRDDKEA